jgi:hypothetical protein
MMNDLKIDLYADGSDIEEIKRLNANPLIKGFTTNPSLMRKSGITNYIEFVNDVMNIVKYSPVSFEVFSDDIDEMEIQAKKIAKYYIKCVQIKTAIHFVTTTPYLEHYVKSLQLLDQYGDIHQDEFDRESILSEDTLLESYISSFNELDNTIKKYNVELRKLTVGINKLSFKGINQLCIRVKEKIKEFHSVREKLFQECLHILETLVEQRKLEKIIHKIKELEAKQLLK